VVEIKFRQCENLIDPQAFESGFTNYMLRLTYKREGNWLYADLMPQGNIEVSSCSLSHAIAVGETVRISEDANGKLAVFRLDDYIDRLEKSGIEMGLPALDKKLLSYGITQLLSLERPYLSGGNVFAHITLASCDPDILEYSVREAVLTVILQKVKPSSFKDGISVIATNDCMLSHPHKNGAHYMHAVRESNKRARESGFDSALWLDGVYNRYIESLSGHDLLIRIGERVIMCGDGVTVASAKQLLADWGIEASPARVSTDWLKKAYADGTLREIFALNTRDLVLPVAKLKIGDDLLTLDKPRLAKKLYDALTGIEKGEYVTAYNWVTRV